MKYSFLLSLISFLFIPFLWSQDQPAETLSHLRINSLDDPQFTQLLMDKMENTQFILLGEQHGVREIGALAKHVYSMAHPLGYNTYCIETDALAAEKISAFSSQSNPVAQAQILKKDFPFSIPFYENPNDYELFQQVKMNGGEIWGIDQVFMAEWRLYFHELAENASNQAVRSKASLMEAKAQAGFQESIEKKQFQSMGMFQFEPGDYEELKALSEDKAEQNRIALLARSHDIYMANMQQRYYENNYNRSQLMKENFMEYYRKAKEQNPKVLFRMGAYHMGRGLTETRIYDIANMASELAQTNGKQSLHILALGIKGQNTIGNPFSPVSSAPYDNQKEIMPELVSVVENLEEKYLVVDMLPLRSKSKSLSKELQKYVFRYDLIILINDTQAYEDLGE